MLLLTLSLAAPAVTVIRVPVERAHGSVSPITDDAVTGAAGTASAGQAYGTEPAHVCTLVLRLAPARAHFLEEKATGSARAAHYAVIVIGDPVIPTHGCVPRGTALRPQEHLGAPRAWVHAANTAQVTTGTLAGVTRAIELLEDVLLAGACVAQKLALAGVVRPVAAAHGALGGPLAGGRAQARGCVPVC